MSNICERAGWWWPADDISCRQVIFDEVLTSLPRFLNAVKGRSCVIQAGGNVGVLPVALSHEFANVFTVEPDADNYACLVTNVEERATPGRVTVERAAFGETAGVCHSVVVEPANCGANRIEPGDGDTLIITLDSLKLKPDAIWLDIEGFELQALRGAQLTIEKHSPVICVEDKGLSRTFGVEEGSCAEWLKQFGYQLADMFGRDKLYRRTK